MDPQRFIINAPKKDLKRGTKKESETEFYIPNIPVPWIVKIFGLSFVALKTALVLWRAFRMERSRNPFKLTTRHLEPFGLSRNQKYRGLNDLKKAGLIKVSQKPGQAPEITLLKYKN
jgi:hypothetical protein